MGLALPFYDRHRGPYRLHVTRPHKRKPGFFTSESLTGSIRQGADALDEAKALVEDPRDTIDYVAIWSESEECFVGGVSRQKEKA